MIGVVSPRDGSCGLERRWLSACRLINLQPYIIRAHFHYRIDHVDNNRFNKTGVMAYNQMAPSQRGLSRYFAGNVAARSPAFLLCIIITAHRAWRTVSLENFDDMVIRPRLMSSDLHQRAASSIYRLFIICIHLENSMVCHFQAQMLCWRLGLVFPRRLQSYSLYQSILWPLKTSLHAWYLVYAISIFMISKGFITINVESSITSLQRPKGVLYACLDRYMLMPSRITTIIV